MLFKKSMEICKFVHCKLWIYFDIHTVDDQFENLFVSRPHSWWLMPHAVLVGGVAFWLCFRLYYFIHNQKTKRVAIFKQKKLTKKKKRIKNCVQLKITLQFIPMICYAFFFLSFVLHKFSSIIRWINPFNDYDFFFCRFCQSLAFGVHCKRKHIDTFYAI